MQLWTRPRECGDLQIATCDHGSRFKKKTNERTVTSNPWRFSAENGGYGAMSWLDRSQIDHIPGTHQKLFLKWGVKDTFRLLSHLVVPIH